MKTILQVSAREDHNYEFNPRLPGPDDPQYVDEYDDSDSWYEEPGEDILPLIYTVTGPGISHSFGENSAPFLLCGFMAAIGYKEVVLRSEKRLLYATRPAPYLPNTIHVDLKIIQEPSTGTYVANEVKVRIDEKMVGTTHTHRGGNGDAWVCKAVLEMLGYTAQGLLT